MPLVKRIVSLLGEVVLLFVSLLLGWLSPAKRQSVLSRRLMWKIVLACALLGSLSACLTPSGQAIKANPYSALLKEYSPEQGSPTPLHSPPMDPKKSSKPTEKTPSGAPQ